STDNRQSIKPSPKTRSEKHAVSISLSISYSLVKDQRAKELSRNSHPRQDCFVSVKQLLYPQTPTRQHYPTKKMTFFFQAHFMHRFQT
ncbi:hypothetical protein, partial [Acetobacter lambici]